jgi:DNA invertase Pin-like site-specific DNA recombinase
LEQGFNSLHAQREACEAFIQSQKHEGWKAVVTPYDDGGYSGGTMERPALQRLLEDLEQRRIRVVVVYKVDRRGRWPISPKSSSGSMRWAYPLSPSPSSSIQRRRWDG